MECNNYMCYLLESVEFIIVDIIVIRVIAAVIALLRCIIQNPRGADCARSWLCYALGEHKIKISSLLQRACRPGEELVVYFFSEGRIHL